MPAATVRPDRYVADPQDRLEIISESRNTVVLKVQARDNRVGRTREFEFELNSKQLQALLTFGATAR
ncbi:MAG: hypothetical protein HYT69_02080 [Candidatus Zambryskibacteria bacterium]|nr:hypothetical protein [Candidatus Zambryskibacteria bacterium]